MSLPQRIPYGFSACLILALLLFFLAEAHARSASGEERGSRTSVELKTSDGSLSNGQTPKLELRTFTIEMLNDGVHVSTGIGLENGGVVRSQLRDGAVMTLTCKLALERVRTLLSNEVISEESRSYQLRHDLLSREFILSSQGTPLCGKSSLIPCSPQLFSIWIFFFLCRRRLFPGKLIASSSRSLWNTPKFLRGWKKLSFSGHGKSLRPYLFLRTLFSKARGHA